MGKYFKQATAKNSRFRKVIAQVATLDDFIRAIKTAYQDLKNSDPFLIDSRNLKTQRIGDLLTAQRTFISTVQPVLDNLNSGDFARLLANQQIAYQRIINNPALNNNEKITHLKSKLETFEGTLNSRASKFNARLKQMQHDNDFGHEAPYDVNVIEDTKFKAPDGWENDLNLLLDATKFTAPKYKIQVDIRRFSREAVKEIAARVVDENQDNIASTLGALESIPKVGNFLKLMKELRISRLQEQGKYGGLLQRDANLKRASLVQIQIKGRPQGTIVDMLQKDSIPNEFQPSIWDPKLKKFVPNNNYNKEDHKRFITAFEQFMQELERADDTPLATELKKKLRVKTLMWTIATGPAIGLTADLIFARGTGTMMIVAEIQKIWGRTVGIGGGMNPKNAGDIGNKADRGLPSPSIVPPQDAQRQRDFINLASRYSRLTDIEKTNYNRLYNFFKINPPFPAAPTGRTGPWPPPMF